MICSPLEMCHQYCLPIRLSLGSHLRSYTASIQVNNVWGAVITEELLTEDLGKVSMASPQPWTQDRQCESYDYMRRELDPRPRTGEPDIPVCDDELVTTHDDIDVLGIAPRGAKRSLADRLGERACTRPSRSRRPVGRGGVRSRRNESGSSKSGSSEREEGTVAEVVADIAGRLQEPKVDLLGKKGAGFSLWHGRFWGRMASLGTKCTTVVPRGKRAFSGGAC